MRRNDSRVLSNKNMAQDAQEAQAEVSGVSPFAQKYRYKQDKAISFDDGMPTFWNNQVQSTGIRNQIRPCSAVSSALVSPSPLRRRVCDMKANDPINSQTPI